MTEIAFPTSWTKGTSERTTQQTNERRNERTDRRKDGRTDVWTILQANLGVCDTPAEEAKTEKQAAKSSQAPTHEPHPKFQHWSFCFSTAPGTRNVQEMRGILLNVPLPSELFGSRVVSATPLQRMSASQTSSQSIQEAPVRS